MKTIKKHKLAILLAVFLYILSITLLLLYVKNLNTNNYNLPYNNNPHSTITKKSNNRELEIVTLEQLLLKKRLYHLDSIYTHINNLYNAQCDLYAKGIGDEKIIKILEIEKNMALHAINNYKKKQLSSISSIYIR